MVAARTRPRRQPAISLSHAVRLRAWTALDAPALVLAHRDPLLRRYATTIVTERSQAQALLTAWAALWPIGDGAAWALADAGDTVLGAVIFTVRDRVSGRAEAGYWLVPEGRGRGLAGQALRAGTDAVLTAFAWHRIEASHAVGNERSCAVARRAGYRSEALLRQAQFYPDAGTWSDEHLHARIATDSPSSRELSGQRG